jgi:hypothetical protein
VRKEVKMCEHKRLQYVGHRGETRVFCADCGQKLDKAILDGKNTVKNTSDDTRAEKPPVKKTRAKKAV